MFKTLINIKFALICKYKYALQLNMFCSWIFVACVCACDSIAWWKYVQWHFTMLPSAQFCSYLNICTSFESVKKCKLLCWRCKKCAVPPILYNIIYGQKCEILYTYFCHISNVLHKLYFQRNAQKAYSPTLYWLLFNCERLLWPDSTDTNTPTHTRTNI